MLKKDSIGFIIVIVLICESSCTGWFCGYLCYEKDNFPVAFDYFQLMDYSFPIRDPRRMNQIQSRVRLHILPNELCKLLRDLFGLM